MAAGGMHKVFVYGTLKRGQRNHHLMQGAEEAVKFIGAARLAKPHPLILTKYGIPMLLAKEGAGKIVEGELYEVNDAVLEKLDDLEDHPTLYTRTHTHCHLLTPHTSTSSPPFHSTDTTPTEQLASCETYMIFDFTNEALQLPHYTNFDANNLPEGVSAPPSVRDTSPELIEAIHKSLLKIKKGYI